MGFSLYMCLSYAGVPLIMRTKIFIDVKIKILCLLKYACQGKQLGHVKIPSCPAIGQNLETE